MMFTSSRVMEALMTARQANEAASSASSAAVRALSAIETHAAVCTARQQSIDNAMKALAHGQEKIGSFLGKVMWGVILMLLTIIGFGGEQIAEHSHWFGG